MMFVCSFCRYLCHYSFNAAPSGKSSRLKEFLILMPTLMARGRRKSSFFIPNTLKVCEASAAVAAVLFDPAKAGVWHMGISAVLLLQNSLEFNICFKGANI
jgi:hypothetical protein